MRSILGKPAENNPPHKLMRGSATDVVIRLVITAYQRDKDDHNLTNPGIADRKEAEHRPVFNF